MTIANLMTYSDLTPKQIEDLKKSLCVHLENYAESLNLPPISDDFKNALSEIISDQINIAKMAENFNEMEKRLMKNNKIKDLFKNP